MTAKSDIRQLLEERVAEEATGCTGAGAYRQWAKGQGYDFCTVLDWTSSAGDWSFLVSQDGETWFVMTQENNWPRGYGFTRQIDTELAFYGTEEEALDQAYHYWD